MEFDTDDAAAENDMWAFIQEEPPTAMMTTIKSKMRLY